MGNNNGSGFAPAIEFDGVRVFHGDCREVLKSLPDNSVDSIVTDPPYGLSNTTPELVSKTIVRWVSGDRDFIPTGAGFMGKEWDSFVPPPAVWDECLRVLKPGGHLLAFFGSRTMDLGQLAIRLAGFEIRDNVAWLYGSGFPKSLDVSKAIDKGQGVNRDRQLQFTAWMRSTGITAEQINEATGTSMASHYLTDKSQPAIATADLFDKLRPYLPEVPEEIERLVAERTGIEWTAYKQREVIGQQRQGRLAVAPGQGEDRSAIDLDITLAKTPEAQKWQGWGTALKPAFEPIVVGRKPLRAEIAVRAIIENELKKRGEKGIRWTRLASDAIKQNHSKPSGSTKAPKTVETFAKTASEQETQSTGETILNSIGPAHGGLQSETQGDSESLQEKPKQILDSKSLTTTETSVPAAEKLQSNSLRSITSKVGELDTESALMEMSGQSLGEMDSLTVIESFVGIATGLPGESESVLINKLSDGSFQWPYGLPEVFKTGNTVAENVLEWGTGGLNIDGSRIGTTVEGHRTNGKSNEVYGDLSYTAGERWEGSAQGRWPANVILDEHTAELLDQQSGVSNGGKMKIGAAPRTNVGHKLSDSSSDRSQALVNYGDSGGASRFFYVAKASKRDRNEGLDGLEETSAADMVEREPDSAGMNSPRAGAGRTSGAKNFHPTVKPTQLMRYLIKLVTPSGGTVLDPFTGSGSTGKAAILDGFEFVGAELTEEYLPIIEGRLKWALENRESDDTLF